MDSRENSRKEKSGKAELDWRVEITGDLIEVKAAFLRPPRGLPKKRGRCKGFTRASRLRMLKMVSKVDWAGITRGLFITLTYPDEVSECHHQARQLQRYKVLRSLENYCGNQFGALWRIEWKKRQSGVNRGKFYPHFHLIVPGVKFIPHEVVRAAWRSALGVTGPLATDVRKLSDKSMHQVYIAKYAAKMPDPSSLDYLTYPNIDGRHWGVHRPELIPRHKTIVYDGLSEQCVNALKDMARGEFKWYGEYAELGFCMFGKLGASMVRAVSELCLDYGFDQP